MAVYSIGGKPTLLTPAITALFANVKSTAFLNRVDFAEARKKWQELNVRAAGQSESTPREERLHRIQLLAFSVDVKDKKRLEQNTPPQFRQFLDNRLRCVAFYEEGGDDKIFDAFTGKTYLRFEYENALGIQITGKACFDEAAGVFSGPQPATTFYSKLIADPPAVSKAAIALDPGHSAAPESIFTSGKGGEDPGACFQGKIDGKQVIFREAVNTFATVEVMLDRLQNSGLSIVTFSTMEMYPNGMCPDGIRPPLEGRATYAYRRAKEFGAALILLLSVHNDSFAPNPNKLKDGASALYVGEKSEAIAKHILAEHVKRVAFNGEQAFTSRGAYQPSRTISVLKKANELGIRNVLLEIANLQAQARLLSTEPYRTQIANIDAEIVIDARQSGKL